MKPNDKAIGNVLITFTYYGYSDLTKPFLIASVKSTQV